MTEPGARCAVPATAAMPADAPMFNRAAWIRILPFAAYLFFIAVGDLLARLRVSQDALRWLYPARIAVVALLLALFWRRYHELSRFRLAARHALTALATGAVVPVMGETFWRSFLMRWVDAPDFESVEPSQLSIKSFVITGLLFGFEHNLWLAGIVAGVAYSLLYIRHSNLWSPILAHAVTNGLLGVWVVRTGNWAYW
jgi:hypothetical protein